VDEHVQADACAGYIIATVTDFNVLVLPAALLFTQFYSSRCGIVREMANLEHVEVLRTDVDEWNEWRSEQPDLQPDLCAADLRKANLAMADLRHAHLNRANLAMADLMAADLRGADLRGASLVGARLIGVDLQGADLRGADLRTAEDLTSEQLEETIGDETTVLPDGSTRPQRWMSVHSAR
jgi:uncharacterized protein YjbI with pentapeptide repeats